MKTPPTLTSHHRHAHLDGDTEAPMTQQGKHAQQKQKATISVKTRAKVGALIGTPLGLGMGTYVALSLPEQQSLGTRALDRLPARLSLRVRDLRRIRRRTEHPPARRRLNRAARTRAWAAVGRR